MLSKTHRVVFEPFDAAACANHKFRAGNQRQKWVGIDEFDHWSKPNPVRKGDVIDIAEPYKE